MSNGLPSAGGVTRAETEHDAMISCVHAEPDQLGPCCLLCGRISVDPSWFVVGFGSLFFFAHVAYWVAL